MTFNKFVSIYFCYWTRQEITVVGTVYGSVALVAQCHLVFVYWHGQFSSCSVPARFVRSPLQAVGGNVELPV